MRSLWKTYYDIPNKKVKIYVIVFVYYEEGLWLQGNTSTDILYCQKG